MNPETGYRSPEQEFFGKNYYDILGVSASASQQEISEAFKRLSRELHPDKGGDTTQYQYVSEAYNTLKDQNKRIEYHKRTGIPFETNLETESDLVKTRITNSGLPEDLKRSILNMPLKTRRLVVSDQTLLNYSDEELINLFGWGKRVQFPGDSMWDRFNRGS